MKRNVIRTLALGAALLLLLGVAAPFVHADRYRGVIQTSLSTALGRKVSIGGHVSFSLLTGPALAVDDVKIAEADDSTEPFAYVDEVRAVPRLYSFWTGHLEFASLILDGAHVNLVRGGGDSPSWNFEPLLRPGLLAAFPSIHMRDSRINFVLDGRKSPFYLLGADLDVTPRSNDGSDWSVRFAGAPARSDRPARGFGALEAKGSWNGRLTLDLSLQRSEMSDILALLYGRDAGVHGIISGQAHVAGSMRTLGVEGEVRISELHGWDQSPPASAVFPFRVSGTLDTPGQHLELFAQPRAGQPKWMMHFTAESYLERPLLRMEFRSDGIPIAPLPGLLHNFGANLPEGLQLSGVVNGLVVFDSREGWTGNANLPEVNAWVRGGTPLTLNQAAFTISGNQIVASPVSVASGQDTIAEASATYSLDDGALQVKLVSKAAPVEALTQRFPAASIPFLSDLHSGTWTGDLTYSQTPGGIGTWRGEGELSAAKAALPALAQPIELTRAHVGIDGADIALDPLTLMAGAAEIRGNYSFRHSEPVPHQFHLVASRADLPGLETLLGPLLNRSGSLIDRALGRSSVPKWLTDTQASGTLQIDALETVVAGASRVRTNVLWEGVKIALTGLTIRDGKATLLGTLNLDLKNPKPRYSGTGTWTNLPWKGGLLSGTLAQFETSGSGIETLTNLKMRGELTGKDLDLEPLGQIDRMTGSYSVLWNGTALRFRFPSLRLTGGGEVWTGSGTAQGSDGEVTLQPTGGRQITLAGSLTDASKDWVER